MVRKFALALVMSPLFVHAQSPVAQSNVAKLDTPAASNRVSHIPAARITTGVTAPRILERAQVYCTPSDMANWDLAHQNVSVSMVVGKDGQAHNIHILSSANDIMDSRILEAVKKYRFAPARLDNQDIEMSVTLHFNFQHDASTN